MVSAETDAKLPNGDEDDGVVASAVRAGFSTQFTVDITNTNNRPFFLDAWFDWNQDGQFEDVRRFSSTGANGRGIFATGAGNNFSIPVPASAASGETFARFRLSEDGNLGPVGDATSGEVEDVRLVVANNPFQNPTLQHDVNNSGAVTPIDALQVINVLGRAATTSVNLSVLPLPSPLPTFPDVNGNGFVTALDALLVINELARLPNSAGGGESVAEGEMVTGGFVPATSGVLASGVTALGDALIAQALETEQESGSESQTADQPSTIDSSTEESTSVFDHPSMVQLDGIVDTLAEDTAAANDDDENASLDQLFASL